MGQIRSLGPDVDVLSLIRMVRRNSPVVRLQTVLSLRACGWRRPWGVAAISRAEFAVREQSEFDAILCRWRTARLRVGGEIARGIGRGPRVAPECRLS